MPGPHPQEWQLSALLDDELAEGEARVVTVHVADCATCRDELGRLRDARSALRGLPGLAIPDVVLADLAATTAAAAARSRRRVRRGTVGAVGVAGAAAGLWLLGAAAEPTAPRGEVAPPVERFVADHVEHGDAVVVPVRLGP